VLLLGLCEATFDVDRGLTATPTPAQFRWQDVDLAFEPVFPFDQFRAARAPAAQYRTAGAGPWCGVGVVSMAVQYDAPGLRMSFTSSSWSFPMLSQDTTRGDIMKRVAPILLALCVLAVAKKKAMAGHDQPTREQRRQHFEEKARAWHLREHEAMAE
jgi:hypothetical protein